MYQRGELVVYGSHGVCRIVDQETLTVDRKKVNYLVLEPVGQEGARYLVPTNNAAVMGKLRPMLNAEELEELFCSEMIRSGEWNRDENARKQSYRDLISSGDRVALMRMVYTLYRHRKTQAQAGKKVHLADENFLRDAERLLAGEISVIKNLTPDDAKNYLRNALKVE